MNALPNRTFYAAVIVPSPRVAALGAPTVLPLYVRRPGPCVGRAGNSPDGLSAFGLGVAWARDAQVSMLWVGAGPGDGSGGGAGTSTRSSA